MSIWQKHNGPTWCVALSIYGGWLASVIYWEHLPALLLPLAGGWLVAWHGSLQHESIHGHPTRHSWLNVLVAAWPLSLWLPYAIYRQTHLRHHCDEHLTDPARDPESFYVGQPEWRCSSRLFRRLTWFNQTLFGRLTLGPLLYAFGLWASQLVALRHAESRHKQLRIWLPHVVMAVPLLLLIERSGLGLWRYCICFVYPGTALSLLRSFVEHRAAADVGQRTAIVEGSPLFALLFLNNSLHAVHHRYPHVPWHRLPVIYRSERDQILEENGGYVFSGYGEIVRRYGIRPHDSPIWPLTPEESLGQTRP